ncbi:MAG TPA: CRTAC1 family protein [Bryobacteraceae bacterium]|nr:CRTAC1 family protein [Bryobacteraceae bacterium]
MSAGLLFAIGWEVVTLPFTLFSGETDRKHLPAAMPGGVAVFDADGDGQLDIFFANGAPLPSARKTSPRHLNRLFRNTGNLKFVDVTDASGLGGSGFDIGAAAADFDNDGRVDLLVCSLTGVTLYRNAGQGRFVDVTESSGINNRGRWSVGAAWFDLDNDGDRDLFVVNYVKWDAAAERTCVVDGKPDFCHPKFYDPEASAVFRNNGDGTFTDVSTASGVAAQKGKGMAAAAADFDGDGRTDIFVTNDRVFNFLFRNRGDGKFDEVAFQFGTAAPASGNPPSAMGVDAADYDNDGKPDLVYTALRDETFPLYRNLGPELEEATLKTRLGPLTRPMSGWGIAFADLDNDGWKDLALARSDVLSASGSRAGSVREPVSWLRNEGGRQFSSGGTADPVSRMNRGLTAADLDQDGCMDLVVTALNEPARILRNRCGSSNRWLAVNVRVPGARVRVDNQWRHQTEAGSYASSCACPLHFGLGDRTEADVEVFWPRGGSKKLGTVKADQVIEVKP